MEDEKNGFIVIHRKMLDWEWFSDPNTLTVFMFLLLSANWKAGRFQGVEVPRGSLVTSYPMIAQKCHISVMSARTAIKHLKLTGEITAKSYARFSVISIKNYDRYQDKNRQANSLLTVNQQAPNNNRTKEQRNKETIKPFMPDGSKQGGTVPEQFTRMLESRKFPFEAEACIKDWLKYRAEADKPIRSEEGMKQLLNQIEKNIKEHGSSKVTDLIKSNMASGYTGITWNQLSKTKRQTSESYEDSRESTKNFMNYFEQAAAEGRMT